mmetsp:Transcript_98477/g.287187  ORF Transcript_98477/g.287187 Transcript_98477/m.287187 type:complete len:392 (-) Transcript_98477:1193-2368(-)
MLRILQDLPAAGVQAASARLLAPSPVAPLRESAINGLKRMALLRLVQGGRARRTVKRGRLDDGTLPVPLANLPVHLAIPPGCPVRERAIPLVEVWQEAALGLAHRATTGSATLVVCRGNVAVPFTEACGGRLAPRAPLSERAVLRHARWTAGLHVWAFSHVQLRTEALGATAGLEEEVLGGRLQAQRSAPHHRAMPAASAAATGLGPLRPGADEGFLAMSSAVGDLLGALEVAHLAAMVRHLLDGTVTVLLTLALVAIAPLGPHTPLAVRAQLQLAFLRVAWAHRSELPIARLAAIVRQGQDLAPPLPLASTARLGAWRPVRPLAELAVDRAWELALPDGFLTDPRAARRHLLQRSHVAMCPVARREDLDVAIALVRAVACGRADGPLAPL